MYGIAIGRNEDCLWQRYRKELFKEIFTAQNPSRMKTCTIQILE